MTAAESLVSDRLDGRSRSRDGLGTRRYWYGACRVAVQHISARSHTFQTRCSMQGVRLPRRAKMARHCTGTQVRVPWQAKCRIADADRSVKPTDTHSAPSPAAREKAQTDVCITLHSQAPVVEFTGQPTASPSQMTGALACVCAHCA